MMKQIPGYMKLVSDDKIDVPTTTFPLSDIAGAWASTGEACRAVVVPS
jgi:hypothetical protein